MLPALRWLIPLATTLTLVALTPAQPSRAQAFPECDDSDGVCAKATVFRNNLIIDTAEVDTLLPIEMAGSYKFPRPGTYTNVRVTVDVPAYFVGQTTSVPDGWSRECTPGLVAPTFAAIWDIRCVFTYTANAGQLEVTNLLSGTLKVVASPQRYSTPLNHPAALSVRVDAIDPDGLPVSDTHTTTVTMLSEPELSHSPAHGVAQQYFGRTDAGYFGVVGTGGDTATGNDLRGRRFAQTMYVRNYNLTTGEHGSRAIVGATLRVVLPDGIIYLGWRHLNPLTEGGSWREVTGEHTAVPGTRTSAAANNNVVSLAFDGMSPSRFLATYPEIAGAWWPLGVSGLMRKWDEIVHPLSSDSAKVVLDWLIDCDDLPFTNARLTNTPPTEMRSSATTTDPNQTPLTYTSSIPLWAWLGGTEASDAFQNLACGTSWSINSTWKSYESDNHRPPIMHRREGIATPWMIILGPPEGIFALGPTTIMDKLPPYERLLGPPLVSVSNPSQWSAYACRFPSDTWSGPTEFVPTCTSMPPLTCNWREAIPDQPGVVRPNCTTTPALCLFGLNYFLAYEDTLTTPDPDTFDPLAPPWAWDDSSPDPTGHFGCVPMSDVCPYVQDSQGLKYVTQSGAGTGACSNKLMNAWDATHVVFSTIPPDGGDAATNQWVHSTDPDQRPETLTATFWVVTEALPNPPSPGESPFHTNVRNTFRVGGGDYINPSCSNNTAQSFAWLARECPDDACDGTVGGVQVPGGAICEPGVEQPLRRSDFQNMDERAYPRPYAGSRNNITAVGRDLVGNETVFATCGSRSYGGGPQRNPRWTFKLPPGFEPRVEPTAHSNYKPWGTAPLLPLAAGSSDVPELRGLTVPSEEIPDLSALLQRGVELKVIKTLVDGAPEGNLRGDYYQYELELVPDNEEDDFDFYSGSYEWFTIIIEPRKGYPFVDGQTYSSSCTVSGDNFQTVTSTRAFSVPGSPETRLGAQPSCRPGSPDPSYLMRFENLSGANVVQAEAIFVMPTDLTNPDLDLAFAGAVLIDNPNIPTPPVIQVTTRPGLDAAIEAGTVLQTDWTALDSFLGSYSDVTGVRLSFGGNLFTAHETQQVRIDLTASPSDVGRSFTTTLWSSAAAPTYIPGARVEPPAPTTTGQCPVTVELVKRFDSDGDGQIDDTDELLDNWTLNLDVEQGSAIDATLLLDEDGNPAPNGHDNKSGLTVGGRITFLAWPGQDLVATETLPAATTAFGPFWNQIAPSSSYSITVGHTPESRTFLNDCACTDANVCGGEDACVAPGVCQFGAVTPEGATTTTPVGDDCAPTRLYALVEDESGNARGAFICWHDPSASPSTWCAATAAGAASPSVPPPPPGAALYISPDLTCQ